MARQDETFFWRGRRRPHGAAGNGYPVQSRPIHNLNVTDATYDTLALESLKRGVPMSALLEQALARVGGQ